MFPYIVINATSLYFHNRRFETPAHKKNISDLVEEWAQGLPPPPLKRQRTSATGSVTSYTSSHANPNHRKAAIATTATTKSTSRSCAVIVGSTTEVLKKKSAPGTKRRAEVLESAASDDDEDEGTVSNLRYAGLDEDEDDTLEQADAALSPMKPSVAALMSKVSPPSLRVPNNFVTYERLTVTRIASLYIPESQPLPRRRSPSGDKAIRNSLAAHLTMGGGRAPLSQRFSDMLGTRTRMPGPSTRGTPLQHYK